MSQAFLVSKFLVCAGMGVLQIFSQLPRPERVPQTPKRLSLDLSDSLPGQAKFLTDLFQGVALTIFQSEAEAENPSLSGSEGGKHFVQFLTEHFLCSSAAWCRCETTS